MSTLGKDIQEGTIEILKHDYGFVRPLGGGTLVFFHAKDEHRTALLETIEFSARGSVPGVVPTVGARIVFRVAAGDDGRPKAAPWGFPVASVAEINYATEPIDKLIARKHAGLAALLAVIPMIIAAMTELEFRVFAAITPDGEELWNDFKAWRKAEGRENVMFIEFVRATFDRNAPRMVGPRQCLQPVAFRSALWMDGFAQRDLRPSTRDLILLLLEDPVTLQRLGPSTCHGCDKASCPLWGAANRSPRRR